MKYAVAPQTDLFPLYRSSVQPHSLLHLCHLFGVVLFFLSFSLSLHFAPPIQTSPSWRTSPSKTWATRPSVWAGLPSTPPPSPATGSQWWQPGRAYPFLRTLSCQALVNTLSTGWSLASTMTSLWLQWLKTARVSPPPSPSRPVS